MPEFEFAVIGAGVFGAYLDRWGDAELHPLEVA